MKADLIKYIFACKTKGFSHKSLPRVSHHSVIAEVGTPKQTPNNLAKIQNSNYVPRTLVPGHNSKVWSR